MKAPLNWLKEYVEIPVTTDELVKKMIMHGLGVEGVFREYEAYDLVVVGKLLSVEKHPNADRLSVCIAEVGTAEPMQIITGADNVYVGMICPIALVGADLPCGKHIEAGELREVKSNGMLCSGEELCISEVEFKGASVHGILDLGQPYAGKIGQRFFEAAGMDGEVVEFEIPANRADCMSIVGIAREIGAALNQTVREPAISVKENDESAFDYVKIDIQDETLCPRYTARIFKDIKIEPSPLWMQRRLLAAGTRPISNIVDITNYVMLELGYPLHAFDYACVNDGHIIVRRSVAGEVLVTLDGNKRELDNSMLVIADPKGAIGLAGVMGGENSEITENTKMVLLEAAKFDGPNNRRTSRALGLMSEAAARFSKGLDNEGIAKASDRAAQLFVELGCGTVLHGRVDTQTEPQASVTIQWKPERINEILGSNLTSEAMVSALKWENVTSEKSVDVYVSTIPYYRQDLRIIEDLAEEIGRIEGYDNLPMHELKDMGNEGGLTKRQTMTEQVRQLLAAMGLRESMTLSLIGQGDFDALGYAPDDIKRDCVKIMNPLSEEYSLMRTTVVPSIAKALSLNARNKNEDVALFELSNIYTNDWQDGLPKQTTVLCIGVLGDRFLWLKGVLSSLFRRFGATLPAFINAGGAQYHPGRRALIANGETIVGEMGELHPNVLVDLDINQRAVILEINLDVLLSRARAQIAYQPLPRYPAVIRDMAVLVLKDVPVGSMMDTIEMVGGPLVESVALFDVYTGEQVPEGHKSVAFTLRLRDLNKTLRDEEVNALFARVVEAIASQYGAKLRGN